MVRHHGNDIRYVVEWGQWVVWDGTRWRRDDGGILVQEKAREVAAELWDDYKPISKKRPEGWKQILSFVTASNSAKGVANMVTLARSGVPVGAAELDTDPMLLNCPNGTLDLRTGKLRPHRRDDFLTKLCPTPYDPDAACPTWDRFLTSVFLGKKELITYVRRLMGYGVSGDVSEQILPILHGDGENGKSTLVGAVLNTLGDDYGGVAPRELLVVERSGSGHPTVLLTLRGARVMTASETEDGVRLNEPLIKQLTGGDAVRARGMYMDYDAAFRPTHTLFLSTNHKPVVRGRNVAIWRRLKLLPFEARFSGKECDKRMPEKLREEAPGILAWMVRGCLEWRKFGLGEPECVKLATAAYKEEQDVVGQFLKECCVLDPKASASSSSLWAAFQQFAPQSEVTQTAFGRELADRRCERDHITSGVAKGCIIWKGIRLRAVDG